MERFLEIYGTLPRAGAGSDALTRRALETIGPLPDAPAILDVGCGPGRQTVQLLERTNGTVVALDLLPRMLARTREAAERAGVGDRLTTVEQDMRTMTFPAGSFDVVWCEGAIYFLGFEEGLARFRTLVPPGGHVAVSEAVWLSPDRPVEVVDLWAEYPEIDTVEAKLEVVRRVGLEPLDHFVFPTSAWTEEYYDPMERRIEEKAREWAGIAEAEDVLREARNEIEVFRRNPDVYGYAFFVMRKPDPA